MNNILTIIKKEFARFFGDKRLVFTTIIMPGLLIYLIYSIMGVGFESTLGGGENHVSKVYVQNMPTEFVSIFDQIDGIEIVDINKDQVEDIKAEVKNKDEELLVVFPTDFMGQINDYKLGNIETQPEVQLIYNSSNIVANTPYNIFLSVLEQYEEAQTSIFNVSDLDLASKEEASSMIFAMMMPMLILTFIFSGCMAVAPESIAGEKERGTIATLLITPIKRGHLAIAKILSLSVIALLSGISSFIGTMASLPKLMAGSGSMDTSMYGVVDYFMLLGIIISVVFILITLISILSAFAKTVKEAATLVMPLMIIVMMLGMTSMFGQTESSLAMFFIPIYNSVISISGILSLEANMLGVIIGIVCNIVYACGLAFALAKMFGSEKIMFNK